MVWRNRRWLGGGERVAQSADRDANHAPRARCGDGYAQYRRRRTGMDALQQRRTAREVTAQSDDGYVRAPVGPRGQLVKLVLDPRIYRDGDAGVLAAKITRTVQKAAAQA